MANKKKRQRRREKRRKAATTTTPAPWTGAFLPLLDHLPDGWGEAITRATVLVNEELALFAPHRARLRRDDEVMAPCRDLSAPSIGVQMCQGDMATECGNPKAVACGYGVRDAAGNVQYGRIMIKAGYPPNPGVICHELQHVFGQEDHTGWEEETPCAFDGRLAA